MTIVFFSNYFNHHQKPLADSLCSLEGVDYTFVATTLVPEQRKKLGYRDMTEKYVIDVTLSEENKKRALELAVEADVAIFQTTRMNEYIIPRLKSGKITFEYSERWLKKGLQNLLSPNLWKHQIMYYRYGRNANLFMLCSSAYAPNDYYLLQSYKDRCYKWGYFTNVDDKDVDVILSKKRQAKCRIMWCSRFIGWKHPELVIKLAERLKAESFDFEINMYGNGPLLGKIEEMIKDQDLTNCVRLCGSAPNEQIIKEMQEHNVFLFTSDQNEGWGAVANEAMSNGCALVASDIIGSVPFLVQDGSNGLIFKSKNLDFLYEKVRMLITNRDKCEEYARNAYFTMRDIWSPENAARRFLTLIRDLKNNNHTSFEDGPCSNAVPVK